MYGHLVLLRDVWVKLDIWKRNIGQLGCFPFSPKFQKFWLEIKWNGPFWFGLTGIFGTTFDSTKIDINLNILHRYPDCKYDSLQKWLQNVNPWRYENDQLVYVTGQIEFQLNCDLTYRLILNSFASKPWSFMNNSIDQFWSNCKCCKLTMYCPQSGLLKSQRRDLFEFQIFLSGTYVGWKIWQVFLGVPWV